MEHHFTCWIEFDVNRDFNFKLGQLEIVALASFIAPKCQEDSSGSWTAAKKAGRGRETFKAHLSFTPGFMKCSAPPSASTGIRAWKDVPAWPVDTQDNARIKKRRRRDRVCYFWIKYGRDIKALESDLRAKSFFRCFKDEVYIPLRSILSKSSDIIYSVIRSEIKHKGSCPKIILNSRKECLSIYSNHKETKDRVHLFSRSFHLYMR